MGLSKRYLDTNDRELRFSVPALADAVRAADSRIVFAYLLGSARHGTVKAHSDVDIAVFVEGEADMELHRAVQDAAEAILGDVRCDLGILNGTEPVYRFEALKGELLFAADREKWLTFYSLTCREYEHQMFRYERQRRYRLGLTE
ncbi:MAG: nucleotidyltransferase domain-containing protein [Rectinemataceae bacterium]